MGLLPDEDDPMFKDVRFNERQERLERGICKLLDAAKAAREAPNEAAWEHIVDEAAANSRPQAVIGPPGTGKTTVIDKCVRRCLRQGGRVLFALPTAQQASRVRTKHPEADVDTCAERLRGGHGLPDSVRYDRGGRGLSAVPKGFRTHRPDVGGRRPHTRSGLRR